MQCSTKRKIYIQKLVEMLGAKIAGGTYDQKLLVKGTCSITNYKKNKITFVKNIKYSNVLSSVKDAIVIIPNSLSGLSKKYPNNVYLIVDDLQNALMNLQDYFYKNSSIIFKKHISKTANIQNNSNIADEVIIGNNVYIGNNVVIEDKVIIMDGSNIQDNVKIGRNSVLYPNVCVYKDSKIGQDCLIHAGTVIGVDGFRFNQFPKSGIVRKMIHVGGVDIGDRVEIGANCTVARATFEGDNTIIADDVKIDSLVHVGHNSKIGKRSLISSHSCLSGSVIIGEGVWVGAGVTISNGVNVGNEAKLLLNAVVAYDVEESQMVSGFYAMPHRKWKQVYDKFVK